MEDLFTTLAQRTLAVAPRLGPRVPTRFEPGRGVARGDGGATAVPGPPVPVVSESSAPAPGAGLPVEQHSTSSRSPRPRPPELVDQAEPPPAAPPPTPAATARTDARVFSRNTPSESPVPRLDRRPEPRGARPEEGDPRIPGAAPEPERATAPPRRAERARTRAAAEPAPPRDRRAQPTPVPPAERRPRPTPAPPAERRLRPTPEPAPLERDPRRDRPAILEERFHPLLPPEAPALHEPARATLPAGADDHEGRGGGRDEPADVPAIEITIGRIEVRAAAPPEPHRPARTGPTLTLDDYLERRERGRR